MAGRPAGWSSVGSRAGAKKREKENLFEYQGQRPTGWTGRLSHSLPLFQLVTCCVGVEMKIYVFENFRQMANDLSFCVHLS